ncbi:nucleoside 2-deoxyribosyltransferase [Nesterenkonia populi]|uniref:nucleoside 2-deoxyribosyltransferase n=1 Tax=Nesterenkonia populi TaxID=1591087 RepID=UPI0011BEE8BC|nr:nucleoside 2-deoxyribosyltransferase [Nesterenkonia populi]
MTLSVYLAGPEVFLPDGAFVLEAKRQVLRDHGLAPVSPPADLDPLLEGSPRSRGMEISRRNEELVAAADICLANLTPFRGASADAGTVYELGYAAGLNKHVAAYSNDPREYRARVADQLPDQEDLSFREGKLWGSDGVMVEDHGMSDNLMLEGGVALRSGVMMIAEMQPNDPARDLETYVRAVRQLADQLVI